MEQHILLNYEWLKGIAKKYHTRNADADDLTSDTIVKLLSNSEKFNKEQDFRPWARIVMRNIFINDYNHRKCVVFTTIDGVMDKSPLNPEQDEIVSEILSVIRNYSVNSVSVECVVLYADGYTYDEISKMLDIPKGTVMSRISNGRKMLRGLLWEYLNPVKRQ